ncbi:MAG: response regulator [Holophagales bacterium]|jgi:CheY-like chemotaxis protein|nr:response regulator [Holophagales bacterium]
MNSESTAKILYIEDNAANYRLVHRLLSQAGFEMYWAEEGTAGIDLAIRVKPDLILMDINLPGLSGFELTSKLRNQPEFKETPIVALTAKTQKSDRETALVAGCNGFIPKPIDPFNFVSQIKNYLGGRQERLDKGIEGRVLRQFNIQLLEHLEHQLHEAREANQKLTDTQQVLETTNKSLTRLLSLGKDTLREYDTWQLFKKILYSLFLEVQCDSFVIYLQHSSASYWEGLHLAGDELEQAPVLPDEHPFIQKIIGLEIEDDWIHGPSLLAMPIWTDGYHLDIWQTNGQPSLLLYQDRKNEGAARGFWAFDRTSSRPYFPQEIEMVKLYGRFAQVCLENAEMILAMDEKSKALGASYENLEHAYQELQRTKTELHEKERQTVNKDLLIRIANHMEGPISSLSKNSHFILNSLQPDDDQTRQALLNINKTVNKTKALFRVLMRSAQPETANLPDWIDLETLFRDEITFMEMEGLILPNKTQMDINLLGAHVYGIYSDFALLLRTMVLNSAPTPETSSLLRQLRGWREKNNVYLEIQDYAGPVHKQAIEQAFEPFQGQMESMSGFRVPHPGLPPCRQVLNTYGGNIELKSTDQGAILSITIALAPDL